LDANGVVEASFLRREVPPLHYPLKMLVGRVEYFARPTFRSRLKGRIAEALRGRISAYEAGRIALAACIYRRMAMGDEELLARHLAGRLKLESEPLLPDGRVFFVASATIFHSALQDVLEARLKPGQEGRLIVAPAPQASPPGAGLLAGAMAEAAATGAQLVFLRFIRMGAWQARLHAAPMALENVGATAAASAALLDVSLAENPAQYDWFQDPVAVRIVELMGAPAVTPSP